MASTRSRRRTQHSSYAPSEDTGALLYPFNAPREGFEQEVHALNKESFLWVQYARMDDIAVYMLFRKKRSGGGRFSFQPEQVLGAELSSEDTEKLISISKQWPLGLTSEVPRSIRARDMAHAIGEALPHLVKRDDVRVMQQYVCFVVFYSRSLTWVVFYIGTCYCTGRTA